MMFSDRLRQQIANAERRFTEHTERRRTNEKKLADLDAGKIDIAEVASLDNQERVNHRLALKGATSEAILSTADAAPATPGGFRAAMLERVLNGNDLLSSDVLIQGARSRKTVCRVVIRGPGGLIEGYGTGSMISPRLMMTNNHVLDSASTAANSLVQFDYVELFTGAMMPDVKFTLTPGDFFETDEELDFTIVAVSPTSERGTPLADRGWNHLITESGKAMIGERVNIIQHPGGGPQMIAIHQNRVVDVVGDFLHYTTDTKQGSSGSAVANNYWQTAALHHAGVPDRDDKQRILLKSGVPWDGSSQTIGQIAWVANEGARISRIVDELRSREAQMNDSQRALLAGAFLPPPPPSDPPITGGSESFDHGDSDRPCARVDERGRLLYTVPVEIAVGIPDLAGISPASSPGGGSDGPGRSGADQGVPPSAPPPVTGRVDEDAQQAAVAAFKARESDRYFDEDADNADANQYYDGIAEQADLVGRPLYRALQTLLKKTHTTVLSYKTARREHLYPWVDLHPDPERNLRSIYSGEGFDPLEVIREDFRAESVQQEMLTRFMATESASDPAALEAFLDTLEDAAPFNCEHVVPQSWFNEKQPMKADLHHLFTCEWGCNSFRSNIPYFQFPPEDEAVRDKCGRREQGKFEPAAGKGAVARATLYFLIRYGGLIGDEARELQEDRLDTLLKWHAEDPVGLYERHRNQAIRAVQGNRNPLIDYPDWAEHIDFRPGFG